VELISLQGYNLELADSLKLGKSRLIAYSKTGTLSRKINLEGDSENIIALENRRQIIVGIYRGFKNYRHPGFDSLGCLFGLLNEVCKTTKELIIARNFNNNPVRDVQTI